MGCTRPEHINSHGTENTVIRVRLFPEIRTGIEGFREFMGKVWVPAPS